MIYSSYELDKFQEDAIKEINLNNSVVVSAPTGTGKTLIADYLIQQSIKNNKRVIYTSPIKALSNQKYFDFNEKYGDSIGLLTGDISINPSAQILIMTTEIYRNMLLSRDEIINEISYVIFDEVHYITDYDRGTVWEESIIFSPQHIRFLCLSATVPNAREFADWISSIKHHPVKVIENHRRAVPLEHYYFMNQPYKISDIDEVAYLSRIKNYDDELRNLLDYLIESNKIPSIIFSFSRKETEKNAKLIKIDVADSKEKKEIINLTRKYLNDSLSSSNKLRKYLYKGVAYHHAGMTPRQKQLVEILFSKGLIKFLFATETFALGVNMPAKSVAFSSLRKWDGRNFRLIQTKEYFQMAGRAGRRGIDKKGFVYIPLNRANKPYINHVHSIVNNSPEPIRSQYKMSYNTAINLYMHHSDDEIKKILKENLYYFQHKKSKAVEASYNAYLRRLKSMGYIDENRVTEKGIFLSKIYTNELLVSEWAFMNYNYSELEVAIILGILTYEPKPSNKIYAKPPDIYKKILFIFSKNKFLSRIQKTAIKDVSLIVSKWLENYDIEELTKITSFAEGDIIRFFRQILDLGNQIVNSTNNLELKDKIISVMNRINKSHVKII